MRGDYGATIGAIVIGTPLNHERLSGTSDLTSGQALVFGVKGQGDKIELVVTSEQASLDVPLQIAQSGAAMDAAAASLGSNNVNIVTGASKDYLAATAPVSGYWYRQRRGPFALTPALLVPSIPGLLWPISSPWPAWAFSSSIAGGTVLGNYISTPIPRRSKKASCRLSTARRTSASSSSTTTWAA